MKRRGQAWIWARTVFLDASEDVVYIIREESLRVKHRLDQSCDGAQRHIFRVCMTIPLLMKRGGSDVRCEMIGEVMGGTRNPLTSSRCLTFFTNMLPSAAKPFTAKTARSVLQRYTANRKSKDVFRGTYAYTRALTVGRPLVHIASGCCILRSVWCHLR